MNERAGSHLLTRFGSLVNVARRTASDKVVVENWSVMSPTSQRKIHIRMLSNKSLYYYSGDPVYCACETITIESNITVGELSVYPA